MSAEELSKELAEDGRLPAEVLAAIDRVPRDRFLPEELRHRAWENVPLPIGAGQTISQPLIVALMTAEARLGPGASVLEVGTGSGYQAAVLAELLGLGPSAPEGPRKGRVASVEFLPELAHSAAERLRGLGYRDIALRIGDGSLGWPERAPFDALLVTAAAPRVPEALTEQLAEGGRLVIPVGGSDLQELLVIERRGEDFITHRKACWVRFVPLLGAVESEPD